MANTQESFKGDSNGGVDGSSEADVEKRIGDLVDHSVDVRVRVAGQGTVAKESAIAEDEEEVKEGKIYEEFEKGLFPQVTFPEYKEGEKISEKSNCPNEHQSDPADPEKLSLSTSPPDTSIVTFHPRLDHARLGSIHCHSATVTFHPRLLVNVHVPRMKPQLR